MCAVCAARPLHGRCARGVCTARPPHGRCERGAATRCVCESWIWPVIQGSVALCLQASGPTRFQESAARCTRPSRAAGNVNLAAVCEDQWHARRISDMGPYIGFVGFDLFPCPVLLLHCFALVLLPSSCSAGLGADAARAGAVHT
eukprot:358044-Chlamydomonas_euryale.AAC.2